MPLKLLRLWTGPIPQQELFPDHPVNFFKHWFIHPLKRHLAKNYLWLLQHIGGLKVIAITGSAGKTVTKNMLFTILSSSASTVATENNTTSTFNIPTTILKVRPSTKYLILEMSVEYPGDMDFYTWLARPDIGIILNINRTHTVYLTDIASVAQEKGKLLSALSRTGFAVINADDPHLAIHTHAQKITFGRDLNNYCSIVSAQLTSSFTTEIKLIINNSSPVTCTLPLLGEHFAANAAAAVSAASLLGISPSVSAAALSQLPVIPRRLEVIHLKSGPILLNDTHNANPLATVESLRTLSKLAELTKRTPVFVFGQMNELGQYEASAHTEIGSLVKQLGIKHFYCLGPAAKLTLAAAKSGKFYLRQSELIADLQKLCGQHSHLLILIKASRSFHFENIVSALTSA